MTPDTAAGKALLDHIAWLRHKENVDAVYECKSGVDRCGECEEDDDLILAIEAEARREPLALLRRANALLSHPSARTGSRSRRRRY